MLSFAAIQSNQSLGYVGHGYALRLAASWIASVCYIFGHCHYSGFRHGFAYGRCIIAAWDVFGGFLAIVPEAAWAVLAKHG